MHYPVPQFTVFKSRVFNKATELGSFCHCVLYIYIYIYIYIYVYLAALNLS